MHKTIWLIYSEHGEYSDYTFEPLSVADTEGKARAAAELFARMYADKHSCRVDEEEGIWVVWRLYMDPLLKGDRCEYGRFSCREVPVEVLTPEERRKILMDPGDTP